MNLLELATKSEDTFVSKGFYNWKHAIEKFKGHEKSASHAHAVNQLAQRRALSVEAQISTKKAKDQQDCRIALVKLFSSVRFLLRQDLAFRGHETDAGNYAELVRLCSEDCKQLQGIY